MLFRKRIPKSCSYCVSGTKLNDEQILCIHKGICTMDGKCRKFTYDPCKRIPHKMKASNFSEYDKNDFSL